MINSFGNLFRYTTWGESHGKAIGVVVDGIIPNFELDLDAIQKDLDRRRPGQSIYTTSRKEPDKLDLLSGFFEGKTTGAPLSFIVHNTNQKSRDYTELQNLYRPGHADFTYHKKYLNYDPFGGGRSSARETTGRVIAGSIAKQFLTHFHQIEIEAKLIQVGKVSGELAELEAEILRRKQKGESVGGKVEIIARNVPTGLGEPTYQKLDALLAFALMSIHAVKAVEIGDGVFVVEATGSENNDEMDDQGFLSNHSGGVLGGISTSQDIRAQISLKPTASIYKKQKTINKQGETVEFELKGRHDPCVAYRAVVIAEAMVACVLADLLLLQRALSPIED